MKLQILIKYCSLQPCSSLHCQRSKPFGNLLIPKMTKQKKPNDTTSSDSLPVQPNNTEGDVVSL